MSRGIPTPIFLRCRGSACRAIHQGRQAVAVGAAKWDLWSRRRGRVARPLVERLPRGHEELCCDCVRPRRADGKRVLALGRRRPSQQRHQSAVRRRRPGRSAPAIGSRPSPEQKEASPVTSPRRRRQGTALTSTISWCMRSTSRRSASAPNSTPAFLGFNLFMHTLGRARIVSWYENS